MKDTQRVHDCKLEAVQDDCFDDDAEAEEPEEFEDNWWPAEQENGWWLAGAIARRYEDAGLIQKSDQFDWSWHQEFDHEIEAALQSAEAVEGSGGEEGVSPAAGPEGGDGRAGEGVSAGAEASGASGLGAGPEFGAGFGSGFGGSGF